MMNTGQTQTVTKLLNDKIKLKHVWLKWHWPSPDQTHLKPVWTLMATSRVFHTGLTSMYSSRWSKRSAAWKRPRLDVIFYWLHSYIISYA